MDLKDLESDEPDGWVEVEVFGGQHRLGFKTPDPLEVASVERETREFRADLYAYQRERGRIRKEYGVDELDDDQQADDVLEGEELEAFLGEIQRVQDPDPEQVAPRIDFIARQAVTAEPMAGADPITYGDESDWQSFPESAQKSMIRRMGMGQIWEVYDAITSHEGLEEDEKKS